MLMFAICYLTQSKGKQLVQYYRNGAKCLKLIIQQRETTSSILWRVKDRTGHYPLTPVVQV